MSQQEQITSFLDRFVKWPRDDGQYWTRSILFEVQRRPSTEELAEELLQLGEFRALQLGTWLGTTQGEIITQAVESVMPPFYREDTVLLVEGLKFAASLQQQEGQRAAGRIALALCGVALLLALGLSSTAKTI
jgi:hypothetical protein